MNGIEVKELSKSFGKTRALDRVSLRFEPDKIYGLLGRNGAGKSTLLNIINNRVFADSGEVSLDGQQLAENDLAQSHIYMMSEKNYFPDNFRVRDVYKWTAEFFPSFDREKAGQFSELFHLGPEKKIKGLSTGYSTVYKVVAALAANAPYTLLDEPVLGLDANHRDLLYRTLIQDYAALPRTFVISTHLIEEVATVIEDVLIIKNGRLIENRSCEELLSSGYTVSGSSAAVDRFTADKQVIGTDVLGGLKSAHILGRADNQNLPEGLEINKLDLQKLFIRLTND